MPYKRIFWGILGWGILTLTNCQTSTSTSEVTNEAALLPNKDSPTSFINEDVNPIILTSSGLMNIRSGASLYALVNQGILKEDVLESGEGTFTIWRILDKDLGVIGYVMEHPQQQGTVGGIYITSKFVQTENGLRIGSTWTDLQKKYPGIQAHGSEIEGVVSATIGNYNFQLDLRSWTYEMDQSKIRPDTKIDLIWLSHHLQENFDTINQGVPDHYICFTDDSNTQKRIWVGYDSEEKAILVRHEGQNSPVSLIFEKEEYTQDGAYPVIISFYNALDNGTIIGKYKITHSGNWDYVEYRPEQSAKKFNYTIDHDANPYGKDPCF